MSAEKKIHMMAYELITSCMGQWCDFSFGWRCAKLSIIQECSGKCRTKSSTNHSTFRPLLPRRTLNGFLGRPTEWHSVSN